MIYHLFSPWRLVIEIRSASDPSSTGSSLEGHATAVIPAQDSSREESQKPSRKKDYAEKNFGNIEEAFLRSIGEPSEGPKRSRDDSIKLIYDTNSPSDWLDLVEGHDDHVCFLLFRFSFWVF